MRRLLVCLCLSAACLAVAAKKKPKPPDVEVLEVTGRRSADNIQIDGRVRNSGEKPIRGMILLFNFLGPDKESLTTQKSPIDEEVLEPGKEASFRVELAAPPRAVQFEMNATDTQDRDFRVANAGPFTIE